MYVDSFFRKRQELARTSANQLASLIINTVLPPVSQSMGRLSLLDVGCGDGSWVRAFQRLGVDAYGVDGPWSPYEHAIRYDFSAELLPFAPSLPKSRFDLILSLEFAEHIVPQRSEALCQWMGGMTDIIVFSAATPHQGGTGHVNEQWPAYWAGLFRKVGFVACDLIRPIIWNIESVAPWYRQNTIVYFRDKVPDYAVERCHMAWDSSAPLALAHPRIYARGMTWKVQEAIRGALHALKF